MSSSSPSPPMDVEEKPIAIPGRSGRARRSRIATPAQNEEQDLENLERHTPVKVGRPYPASPDGDGEEGDQNGYKNRDADSPPLKIPRTGSSSPPGTEISSSSRSPPLEDMKDDKNGYKMMVEEGNNESSFGRGYQLLETRLKTTPKTGTAGQRVKLIGNYFPLQIRPTVTFRLYTVTFEPDIDPLPVRKALLRLKEKELGPFLFDGTQIFTIRPYSEAECNFQLSFPLDPASPEDTPQPNWTVKLEYIRDCLQSEPVATQLFNILLKKAQEYLELTPLSGHYFDSSQIIRIPQHKLQLWPGYVTSMRQMEQDILLNVDLAFKVCRTEDVFSIMKNIRGSNPSGFQQACEAAIVGSVVMTTYNRRAYKVTSIDWNLKPSNTFPITRKNLTKEVTFIEYFAKKAGIQLNPSQPMLISAPSKRDVRRGDTGDRILPPEMCYQTGLNDDMRSNFRLMKDLTVHLHTKPQQRLAQTIDFVRRMISNKEVNNELSRWGMRFQTQEGSPVPVQIGGRLLPPEELRFQGDAVVKPTEQADWTMAFRNNRMLLCKPVRNWTILFPGRDGDGIGNLISTMQRVARPLGFILPMPIQIRLNDNNTTTLTASIEKIVTDCRGQIDIILVVLPSSRPDAYAAVKKTCSLRYGIPSQCFLSKNVTNVKGLMSICTKLVIQMNAKLGGQPWGLNNPLKELMVLGFDVHTVGGKCFGAMVATTSSNLASYFSTILTSDAGGVGMAGEVGKAFAKCLIAYRNINGGFPNRIMFYRDGVGEGQLRSVVETEVAALKNTIQSVYGAYPEPKFTMIIVTKRINTRLFLQIGPNQFDNPRPGTVVDDRITCPERYDFFLVPQTARQGTVAPVGFNVISDNSGLDPDKIQRFSFKLCHGYFNWSGTVAVPAPCQYAHKLAFLTGTSLMAEANAKLLNNLHYL